MSLRREFRQSIILATPIIASQLGLMLMGLVDTIVVGRVSAADLAGVGAGAGIFWMCTIPAIGVLMALDALISQAYGAGDLVACNRFFVLGHVVAAALTLVLMPFIYMLGDWFYLTGTTPDVVKIASPFLKIMSLNVPLVLFATVYQRYWQARNVALPMAAVVILANVLNYYANVALVLGEWGFPRLESIGSAYATTISRAAIWIAMFAISLFYKNSPLRISIWREAWQYCNSRGWWQAHKAILVIGIPAGLQMLLEVGAFSITTTLAGRLGAIDLAAHHIVLMIASFTFMFPMGFSAATSVRVGQEVGSRNLGAASRAGWFGITQGATIMVLSSVVLFLWPETIFGWFSHDTEVVRRGLDILLLAALFQLFDGIQVTTSGALRGLGKTRGPMLANLFGHYPIGLLIGVLSCFYWGFGLPGLWIGLISGLFAVSVFNLYLWSRASTQLLNRV